MKNLLGDSAGKCFLQPTPSVRPDHDDVDVKILTQLFQRIPNLSFAYHRFM